MWAGRLALQHPINCSLHLLSLSSLMLFSTDLSSTAVLVHQPIFPGSLFVGTRNIFIETLEAKMCVCIKLKSIFVTEIESVTVSAESSYSFLSWDLRVEGRSNPGLQVTEVSQCDGLTLHHTHPGWGLGWGPITIFMLSWHRLQCGCDGSEPVWCKAEIFNSWQ